MAAQDRAQPFVLLGYRAVHTSPSLDPQLFQLADLSLPLCLPLDDEFSVPTCRAVMREAEKVERLGPPFAEPVTPFGSVFAEHDQPGLFLMKREAKLDQSLGEAGQHLPCVRLALEGHHKVVGIPHDRYTAVRLPTPAMNPEIEDVVQEDIGQERRDHSPNAKGNFCFDRVMPLDRSQVVLDLRLKR